MGGWNPLDAEEALLLLRMVAALPHRLDARGGLAGDPALRLALC
jgi:hypothetical protein